MTQRLPRLTEADLAPDQLRVYRSITGGPRGSGKQAFELMDEAGSLHGPFGIMLHAPRVGFPLQELGAAIRYQTSLTDREREIAILMVATATQSAFEWYAHERVGRMVGLRADELSALSHGDYPTDDPREEHVGRLCAALLQAEPVGDAAFEAISTVLRREAIIAVIVLVGYYRTLAQMMETFDVQAPVE